MEVTKWLKPSAFVRYHIADPLLFYQSVSDTRGAELGADEPTMPAMRAPTS
jgi:hypothetical protein